MRFGVKVVKSKGEYDSKLNEITELYKDVKDADISKELTAELVGEYLFTDEAFVNNLSTKNRNVFQKIYDEIKYLCKTVTAGSKEARQLEKVKRVFDKAYKAEVYTPQFEDSGVRYSLEQKSSKSLKENVNEIMNMTDKEALQRKSEGQYITVKEHTPSVILENVSDAKDIEVIIRFDATYLATRESGVLEGNYHNYGNDFAEKLNYVLEQPDAIVRLDNGRLNLLGSLKTPKGNNSIVSVELNTVKDINGKNSAYNLVISMLPAKDNYVTNLINKRVTNVEYEKENLPQVNPQLHKSLSTINDKFSKNIISENPEKVNENISALKKKQFEIISKNNPSPDEYHTWIRKADDIKTFAETLNDSDWEEHSDFDPDYTWDMAQDALKSGKITVYSSYPIEQGVFVTPSKMEAESYSGNGKVYTKNVRLDNVAWIDPTQGMYAEVNEVAAKNVNGKLSLLDSNAASEQQGGYKVYGKDIVLGDDFPIRSDIKPKQKTQYTVDAPVRKDIKPKGISIEDAVELDDVAEQNIANDVDEFISQKGKYISEGLDNIKRLKEETYSLYEEKSLKNGLNIMFVLHFSLKEVAAFLLIIW